MDDSYTIIYKETMAYERKVIIDKAEPHGDKAKEFRDPSGLKYEIELSLSDPDEGSEILAAVDTELDRQRGTSFIWMPSPWWFADAFEWTKFVNVNPFYDRPCKCKKNK